MIFRCARIAPQIQNPDNLFIYYNEDLPDNPNWELAKKYATFVKVDAPEEHEGFKLEYPQYKSDVFRLQNRPERRGRRLLEAEQPPETVDDVVRRQFGPVVKLDAPS